MDRLENLTQTLSQVTMYDIKSMYNQAKNIVLNVSEMEGKVREATNDDPWGASSTLMQDIAQGTFNFQQFNEIMPCIYSRFMEKEANQWRQIYKALQLLEYIVKHGSERVVDDARSHLSTIKMLRNFHYIDDNGKDQGINVRNRSKELAELLTDLDRIRQERRRAKANRNKYIGSGNDGLSFTSASGSRYGGFGSDEVGSSSGYGGGYDRDWGNGSSRSGGFKDDSGRKGYEEYDAGDDEDKSTSAVDHRRSESLSRANLGSVALPRKAGDPAPARGSAIKSPAAPPAPEKSAKVFDLLGFDADDAAATTSTPAVTASATSKHAPSASLDDDFDDFQSATPVTTVAPSLPPATTSAPKAGNVFDFLGGAAAPAPPPTSKPPAYTPPIQHQNATSVFTMGNLAPAMQPQQSQSAFASFSKPQQPAMGMGMATALSPVSSTSGAGAANASRPNYYSSGSSMGAMQSSTAKPAGTKPAGGLGAFDDLWSMGLGKSTTTATRPTQPTAPKSIKDLEKEKSQAALWGIGSTTTQQQPSSAFGNFGSAAPSSGGDDLLL